MFQLVLHKGLEKYAQFHFLKKKCILLAAVATVWRSCLRHRGAVQHRGDVNVLRSEELLEGLLRCHLQRVHLPSAGCVEPGGR